MKSIVGLFGVVALVLGVSANGFAAGVGRSVELQPLAPPSKASLLFYKASENKNYEMMDTYLGRGADVNCGNCNDSGMPPLGNALTGRVDMKLIRYLVEKGADVNLLTQGLASPLIFAIDSRHWTRSQDESQKMAQAVVFLVESGAKVDLVNSKGKNAMMYLASHGYDRDTVQTVMQLMRFLRDKGTNVDHQNSDGYSALMLAAKGCAIKTVQMLLHLDANPKLENKIGETALTLVEDAAAESESGGNCNLVVGMLRNPEQYRDSPLSNEDVMGVDVPAGSRPEVGGQVQQKAVAAGEGKLGDKGLEGLVDGIGKLLGR